ncbi:hypothetical protein OAO01_07220 [Oligoflexia bacterium]|nr:hypothetical protein [Oligoflexia bacterium]
MVEHAVNCRRFRFSSVDPKVCHSGKELRRALLGKRYVLENVDPLIGGYGDVGQETPKLKTGLAHSEWKLYSLPSDRSGVSLTSPLSPRPNYILNTVAEERGPDKEPRSGKSRRRIKHRQ